MVLAPSRSSPTQGAVGHRSLTGSGSAGPLPGCGQAEGCWHPTLVKITARPTTTSPIF